MSKYPKEYQATKIRSLVQIAARIAAEDPTIVENMDYLWARLSMRVPEIKEIEKCFGCGRSMKVTIYEADLHDALLILTMAREVKKNLDNGLNFTEANKVHIPSLNATNATIKRQSVITWV